VEDTVCLLTQGALKSDGGSKADSMLLIEEGSRAVVENAK